MTLYDIIFYLFAALTIVSALVVVFSRNIVFAAFSLLFTFFGVAGIYILLGADFIAIVQILVYVGGILILLLFGVMLTNRITNVDIKTGTFNKIPAAFAIALLLTATITIILFTQWKQNPADLPATTIFDIGDILLTEYVLIFELLGILLLVALIGAASIARREQE